jgi:hypothetical protein
MPHVGVESLAAGHCQEHRRQDGQRDGEVRAQNIGHRVGRIDRDKDVRRRQDAPQAEDPQNGKPEQHEGAEDPADPASAHALDGEQDGQNDERDRNHVGSVLG